MKKLYVAAIITENVNTKKNAEKEETIPKKRKSWLWETNKNNEQGLAKESVLGPES